MKWWICLILASLTLAVYWRVKDCDFVNYDDPDYVTANTVVQQGLTPQGVAWAFRNLHGERTYWHPITWMSHMLDCQWFGLKPAGHHIVNLIFHTANVLLLFLVLSRMTGALWRSAVVAALFALHPLQTDTVAWITERKNVLSTSFLFLSLWAYVRYAARPAAHRFAWVIIFFAMALMSKPAVVTLPCLLLLLDWWPLRRVHINSIDGRKDEQTVSSGSAAFPPVSIPAALLEKILLLLLSLASSMVTILAHRSLGLLGDAAHLSLRFRVENALVSYARYIGKTLWPDDLAVLYPHPGKWAARIVLACGFVLLAVTSVAIRSAKRRPYLAVGWFWFLGMLVPTIGIVQAGAQAMADRFAYVPIIGLFIMITWAVADLLEKFPARRNAAVLLGGTAIGLCGVLTIVQLGHWQNSITLWEHTLAVTRNNFMAHHDLGVALRESGKLNEALFQFDAALKIKSNALTHFEISRVREAETRTNDAILHLKEAVRLAPQWLTAPRRLAQLLVLQGDLDEALLQYKQLISKNPSDDDVRSETAALLISRGRITEGQEHYREVLKTNPNHLATLNNLAWTLCTSLDPQFRNGAAAVELATRACTLTAWRNATLVGTLAAAQAEVGNFSQATDLAGQAATLAISRGEPTAAAQHEAARALYSAGKPYREDSAKQK